MNDADDMGTGILKTMLGGCLAFLAGVLTAGLFILCVIYLIGK